MEKITISTTYDLKWQINGHENYCISPCGKIFNIQRGTQIKRTLNGGSVGYWIGKKFYTLKELRSQLTIIENTKTPF